MKITRALYKEIQNKVNPFPPESGGILGSKENIIVTSVYDEGLNNEKMCSYTPNVKLLNDVIAKWKEEEIIFSGIFHTHYFGVKTLSHGDQCYIEKIMRSMPDDVNELYFPIVVMPQKEIVAYKAIRDLNQILIQEDEICFE